MTQDLKETKELIQGIKEAFKAGKSIRDIVQSDSKDLVKIFELVKEQASKVEIYSEAIKDVKIVREELKDLDKTELLELIMEIVSAIEEIEKV